MKTTEWEDGNKEIDVDGKVSNEVDTDDRQGG